MNRPLLTLFLTITAGAAFTIHAEFPPVNPAASPEAKAVLHYLYELTGNGILVGVHGFNMDPDKAPELMKEQTGKYMAYYDNDFRYGKKLDYYRPKCIEEVKFRYLEQHTIVGFMWHMTRPMDSESL
jgi:mannan endo-1,4-beta-mannosidase